METEQNYTVVITLEAELYYRDVVEYFYKHHTKVSAEQKSIELLDIAIGLERYPSRGRVEVNLRCLERKHCYVLYYYTKQKGIKIIYYVNELERIVYVTDFFPCESDDAKIIDR